MPPSPLLHRTWKLLCSLKLAIVLASAATLLTMGGSLVMHFNPRVFGNLDRMPLGRWFGTAGVDRPDLAWWLFLAAALVVLLGLNTLCCFIDWLGGMRTRWRKSGEYLIHLGFVLVLAAYIWGSLAGWRSDGLRLFVGETRTLPELPGHALRLEAFEPLFNDAGRPLDMLSTVTLLRGEEAVTQGVVRTNTPLTWKGLVVVPASFGRVATGFTFFLPGQGLAPLTPGASLPLAGGGVLRVVDFLPHAAPLPDGGAAPLGSELGNPAFELELLRPDRGPWRGWYFLRQGVPAPLAQAGVQPQPVEPLFRVYSILTVNRDPGASLALAGGVAMLTGVIFALGSFYYKRARGDRPEVA